MKIIYGTKSHCRWFWFHLQSFIQKFDVSKFKDESPKSKASSELSGLHSTKIPYMPVAHTPCRLRSLYKSLCFIPLLRRTECLSDPINRTVPIWWSLKARAICKDYRCSCMADVCVILSQGKWLVGPPSPWCLPCSGPQPSGLQPWCGTTWWELNMQQAHKRWFWVHGSWLQSKCGAHRRQGLLQGEELPCLIWNWIDILSAEPSRWGSCNPFQSM